ncbi:MAG: LPP20 family lipoprotein [Deltaproteobacteria bacterium]|nr:LPP20 family lipoprotein [Deltaproteobacteria bacterium]MBW2220208.1 LPP20 family lipoprotein [Deltaproteobacteria bacterium]
MKQLFVLVTVLVFALFFLGGCASTPSTVDEYEDAPSWVLDGGSSVEEGSAAVGSAKISKAGMNFTRTEALAYARDELAKQLGVKVKNMVKNFTQSTGIGDDETVDKVSSQVSTQVTKETISGSRQKDIWISPSKDLYVLVYIDSETLKASVKNSVQTSMKNEAALWQQFQAKKAYDDLDKEIEKEFGAYKNQ